MALDHCSGAMALMYMTMQHAERIEAMVLIDSSMYITKEEGDCERRLGVDDI